MYMRQTSATCMGEEWAAFYARSGASPADLWADPVGEAGQLFRARLFPVGSQCDRAQLLQLLAWLQPRNSARPQSPSSSLVPPTSLVNEWRAGERASLADILAGIDCAAEAASCASIRHTVSSVMMELVLLAPEQYHGQAPTHRPNECLVPMMSDSIRSGRASSVLQTLDKVCVCV